MSGGVPPGQQEKSGINPGFAVDTKSALLLQIDPRTQLLVFRKNFVKESLMMLADTSKMSFAVSAAVLP